MTFTRAQQAVIAANEPYLLVSASPGAGKTAVLLARVARLVHDGVSPNRIVIITYTNAAAKELTDRLDRLMPGTVLSACTTLHGFLLSLLTTHGHLIGLASPISVVDEDEAAALLADALDEVAYRGSKKAVEAEVAKGPGQRIGTMTKETIAAENFFYRLKADGILTFNCILFHGERLLRMMAAKGVALGVDHLLCDEVQDFTLQDWRIVEAAGVPNLWCCGDFDQAIFQWRSGEKENGFEKRCKLATPTTNTVEKP